MLQDDDMSDTTVDRRLAAIEMQLRLVSGYTVEAFWHALDEAYSATLPSRVVRCIVCGFEAPSGSYEQLIDRCMFGGGKLERYRCPSCECVFGPQKFLDQSTDFIDRDYALLYSSYEEGSSPADEIRTFRSLSPEAAGLYVNWGCGIWSNSVSTLREQGWDVWGYEPHANTPQPYVVATDKVISPNLTGIFSNNVIEHFRDPVASFIKLGSHLQIGGMMAHSTPCYEYRFPFTRFHSVFLLGRSPEILAERTGFEVVSREADGEYGNVVFRKIADVMS